MGLTNIAWIGRLTGPKGELAYRIISEVAPRLPQLTFTIVGGPITKRFNATGDNVRLVGFADDIEDIFRDHDIIIGAGRVALEAMKYGKPVIAVGERKYIGLISDATIEAARASNFGDCDWHEDIDIHQLISDLQRLTKGEVQHDLNAYTTYLKDYDAESVYKEVMEVYQEARIHTYLKRFVEIPVLLYHRVVDHSLTNSRFNLYVTRDEMERQLISLKRRGFQTVTFKDIAQGVQAKKPVILTFDDGYADNHDILLPILQKHNAKAVIFVLGNQDLISNSWDKIKGEPEVRLMDDNQIRACHVSGYIEIGSHGLNHRRLPQLDSRSLHEEITHSKQVLEELIKDEIISFAYPYGDYNSREVLEVHRAGYWFGIGTVNGPLRISKDLKRIRRIIMFPSTDRFAFLKKTSGYYLRYCRLKGKDF